MSTDDGSPAWLVHLPEHRRAPVLAFVREVIATCPYCGAAIRRDSSRAVDADERIGCFACVHTVLGACKVCGQDVTRAHKHKRTARSVAHEECTQRR